MSDALKEAVLEDLIQKEKKNIAKHFKGFVQKEAIKIIGSKQFEARVRKEIVSYIYEDLEKDIRNYFPYSAYRKLAKKIVAKSIRVV